MIELNTPRLRIRDHKPEDLMPHHQLLSDPKVMWFPQDVMTHSLQQSRENLKLAMSQIGLAEREFYFLWVEHRETGEHVGEIGYTVIGRMPPGKIVEVGYFLREAFWGRGYATEALAALIRFAFEQDGVYRLNCGCVTENIASERVMQKNGLTKEGEFKDCQWHDGRLKDRVAYRILRPEWQRGVSGRE